MLDHLLNRSRELAKAARLDDVIPGAIRKRAKPILFVRRTREDDDGRAFNGAITFQDRVPVHSRDVKVQNDKVWPDHRLLQNPRCLFAVVSNDHIGGKATLTQSLPDQENIGGIILD
jgi:hypothetical protein